MPRVVRHPTESGPRSIMVRRYCLAVVLLGIAWNVFFQHDFDHAVVWFGALVIYGTVVAGAIQHVYREVRVGPAETAAMVASTWAFVLATLIAPRQVGVTNRVTHEVVQRPGQLLPDSFDSYDSLPLHNAPLLSLFGAKDSVSTSPWLAIAYIFAIGAMIGVLVQWRLVWHLGRDRAGVFNPAVTAGGLTTAETLDAPLGTSVTRPAVPRRAVPPRTVPQRTVPSRGTTPARPRRRR